MLIVIGATQLIVFDDVDVLIAIEIPLGAQRFPLLYPIRAANRRTVRDIHDEIRAIQANSTPDAATQLAWLRRMALLPTMVRHLLYRLIERQPHWRKRAAGTVGMTSVGMFGAGGGWGIGVPSHTLSLILGGIAAKPGVVDGQIAIREYLSVTIDFDHDIVDGAPAARFVQRLKELVEAGDGLTDDQDAPDDRASLNCVTACDASEEIEFALRHEETSQLCGLSER